jgi:AraC-like DNA-binding protein
MRSLELVPCKQLRPYVRLIWVMELEEPAAFGPPERIGPDGLLELVFHYRTPLACRYDGEEFERQPRCVAVSQTRRFLEIRPEGPSGLVSVRFQPWGAYHFFRPPVSELADRQAPAEVLWGRAALELEERLAEAAGDQARVALVEQFLLAQLQRHQKADIEPLVRAVWNRRGRVTVSQLRQDLGIGERRLERTFADALGTTPKRFARVARFLHACSLLRRGQEHGLAALALACGYYDQSHFIADFRGFSGMTPRQFVQTTNMSFLELA